MSQEIIAARNPGFKAIGWGGLLSGFFDLSFAFIYYGNRGATPVGILHSIAAGLLGKTAAYEGGAVSAILGFLLHFVISCTAATVYFVASRKIPLLTKHAVPCGLLYGALIYFFMNMIVLPLSAYHSHPWPPSLAAAPIAIHMLGVGLPIALAVRKYAR
jgi:hypothetical protein